jgi:hypothetical protein
MASVTGLVLALSACSSTGQSSGIAQVGKATSNPTASAKAAGSAEDQAIAFAQCMRDNGVDFPDPTVDAQGNPSFADAFGKSQSGGFNPGDTSFRTAMTACADLAKGLQIGGGGNRGFDSTAITEALYTYTQCLRDQGLDVGDITLGAGRVGGGAAAGPGGTSSGANGAPPSAAPGGVQPSAPPAGVRGGGGNITDRMAEQLGQDPTSPAWIAANTKCQPALEKAFTGAGGGAAGSGATGTGATKTGTGA